MLVIRKPRPEEAAVIAALEQVCFSDQEGAAQEQIIERYEVFPENFLLIQEDGIIRGYIDGATNDEPVITDAMFADASLHKPDGKWMTVFGLGVHPNARDHGLASALLRSYIAIARKRGMDGVVLTCKDDLVRWYQRFDFEERGMAGSGHGGHDWHLMVLPFAKSKEKAD